MALSGYPASGQMVAHHMVTTQFELDGFRIVRTLGVVRGIVVRSRSIFGTIGASLQTLVGGNITLLTNLCEKTRAEAFDLMLRHSAELGGNAVVGAKPLVKGHQLHSIVHLHMLVVQIVHVVLGVELVIFTEDQLIKAVMLQRRSERVVGQNIDDMERVCRNAPEKTDTREINDV